MKRNVGILLFFIFLASTSFTGNKKAELLFVKGRVSTQGLPIEGVVVSDGITLCQTDVNGNYAIPLSAGSRFVFISSPAGYQVPVVHSVPQYFKRVTPDSKGQEFNFELLKMSGGDKKHGFVAWADPQLKYEKDIPQLLEAADDLNALLDKYPDMPFHGLGCGDIVGDSHHLYDTIKGMLQTTKIPFYQSIGNHDMNFNNRSNAKAESIFEKEFGPHYYSFNRGEVHYVVLNNVFYLGTDYFYIGYLPEEQLSWLEKDLSYVPHGKTVVVVMHIPSALDEENLKKFSIAKSTQSTANKNALYKILQPYQAHILSGHLHTNNNMVIAPNLFEHNVSSVGGAFFQGPYAWDGTPKGYLVFEVDGSNLTWYYKSLGQDKTHQFRAYPVGNNQEQPGYITANVWNWDPEWKVYWYEDGQRMGEMEAYTGRDPETARFYADKERLDYKWMDAQPTYHMFRAKPISATANIKVEVMDRFGNVYEQKIR